MGTPAGCGASASLTLASGVGWAVGMDARRLVPAPGVEVISSVPPSASRRSSMLVSPAPRVIDVTSNPAVVAHLDLQLLRIVAQTHHHRRCASVFLPRSPAPRACRSTPPPQSPAGGDLSIGIDSHRDSLPWLPAIAMRQGFPFRLTAVDRCQARSRRVSQRLVGVVLERDKGGRRSLGVSIHSISASPSFTLMATRCCCAPSWRLRSSFRRSSSWAATNLWREARRSTMRACKSDVRPIV